MPVDVFGNDDGFVLVADPPGVRVEDLTVELDKGLLTVAIRGALGLDGENPGHADLRDIDGASRYLR
ncbi:MAG: hypothetical protein R3F43_17055 [bacterium]